MYPTQITTLFFSLSLIHCYYKQNTPLFLSSLPVYTTSAVYHFIKHFYSIDIRTTIPICQFDYFFCCIFYIGSTYDYVTRRTIKPPYSRICEALHFIIPIMFIVSKPYDALMWNKDINISERWHAIFHLLISLEAHIYLYNS